MSVREAAVRMGAELGTEARRQALPEIQQYGCNPNDTVTTVSGVTLCQAEGCKGRLELEPLEISEFEGQSLALAVNDKNSGQAVAKISLPLPEGFQITVYEGKGGDVTLLSSPRGISYFLLPGSTFRLGPLVIDMFGEPIELEPLTVSGTDGWHPPHIQNLTHQATVLAAGIGTRILPLTLDSIRIGKPALPLDGGHTVIGQILRLLTRHGFTDIVVNTFHHRESVLNAIQADNEGLRIHEIPEARATGTAGGIVTALTQTERFPGYLDPSKPLLVVQGDAVTNTDFSALIEAHKSANAVLTIGCQKVQDQDVEKFGIIATETVEKAITEKTYRKDQKHSGRIVTFKEKPALKDAGPHRLGSTGFYVLAPEVFPVMLDLYNEMLAQEQEAARQAGQTEPTEVKEFDFAKHLFPRLLEMTNKQAIKNADGKPMILWAEEVNGYWSDIGNPMQYLQTLREIYAGHVGGFELPEEIDTYMDTTGVIFWPGTHQLAEQDGAELSGNIIVGKPFTNP